MDTTKNNNDSGRKHYSHEKADARKAKRRAEGEARQKEHDKLTTSQKIALAKSRPGNSAREIARLTKKLEWEKAQKATAKAVASATSPVDTSKKKTPKSKIVEAAKLERPAKS